MEGKTDKTRKVDQKGMNKEEDDGLSAWKGRGGKRKRRIKEMRTERNGEEGTERIDRKE